jgi:CubicO group peptidase (beta-lactamase class C family)
MGIPPAISTSLTSGICSEYWILGHCGMWTRRDWLKLSTAGLAGSVCGCGSTPHREPPRMLSGIAAGFGGKGWALWEGRSRIAESNLHASGPALSITKTLAGLAVARAVSSGMMRLDEKLVDTFPEWKNDTAKSRITPRMLLQQTSGLDAGSIALYHRPLTDKGRVALSLRVLSAPGSQFRYGASHWEVLAEFLQRKLGKETLEHFISRNVMGPIGLHSPKWRADLKGRWFLSTGAELDVNDLGKLGHTLAKLLRCEGSNGFDPTIYSDVTKSSAANPIYGGGLWKNVRATTGHAVEIEDCLDPTRSSSFWSGACLSKGHPADLVALIGSAGQRVFIWPAKDQVFVRLGRSPQWKDAPLLEALA